MTRGLTLRVVQATRVLDVTRFLYVSRVLGVGIICESRILDADVLVRYRARFKADRERGQGGRGEIQVTWFALNPDEQT
jgi:hypothetical protein